MAIVSVPLLHNVGIFVVFLLWRPCVEGSNNILSFSVETAKTPYMTGQYLTLQCLATRNHSVIEIRRTHPKISLSRSQGGHILKYTMPSVTCADMGIYECMVDHAETETTDIALSDCGPCLCYDDEVRKTIFVDINETAQFSFCVVAYMGIHSYAKINNTLVTKNSSVTNSSLVTNNFLVTIKYWSWDYVKINSSRGESNRFNVTMTHDRVAIEDCGLQVIRVSASSGTLYFLDYYITLHLRDSIITLECYDINVQGGKQLSCTCEETANTFFLPTTTLFYGAAQVSSTWQQVTASVTTQRRTSELICQAQHSDDAKKTQTLQVYRSHAHDGPTVIIVEANNNSGQITLEKNSRISISCHAEVNLSPSLSLRKDETDEREIQPFSNSIHKINITLTYNKAMTECMDTGVYMCHAETGQAATNKTVAVYVKCAQQFTDPDNLSQSYKGQVNRTVSISVPVFGYPEPSVTLTSTKYILSSDVYTLTYIKQQPPHGTVSLMINIKNASYFQNYNLNMRNTEGQLTYSFEIVEGASSEKGSPPPLAVGVTVSGSVASVLVIITIVVVICLLRRKGAWSKGEKHQYVNTAMYTISRRNESEDIPEAHAPEIAHYEEIIDFRSDMPDKPVHCANPLLSTKRDEEVGYEIPVCGLRDT